MRTVTTEHEAKQGYRGLHVFVILTASTLLAAAALFAAFFFWAGSSEDPTANAANAGAAAVSTEDAT